MYNKIFARDWSEQAIEVTASQSQRLSAGVRKLNKIACRNGARDSVHCAFEFFVLSDTQKQKQT